MQPAAACMPFMRSPQAVDVVIHTSRATYSLSRMLGSSTLRSNSPWLQQDAETLASIINHHLSAQPASTISNHVCFGETAKIQNDLKATVLACMHRIGCCFESSAAEQQRLGAAADSMLRRQRSAIRAMNAETNGIWYNVCEADTRLIQPREANAEHVHVAQRCDKSLCMVYMTGMLSSIAFFLVYTVSSGVAFFFWLFITDVVNFELQKGEFRFHSRYDTLSDLELLLADARSDLIEAVGVMAVDALFMFATVAIFQDVVQLRGRVVRVAEGTWSVRGIRKWMILRPKDRGMRWLRCWGTGEGPGRSWNCAQGDISSLRGCEVPLSLPLSPSL